MSTLEHLIVQYGYLAVFGGTLLEGETIVILAGFAAHQGYLRLPLVMLMAFLGSFLCDQAIFLIGKRYGRRAIERRPAWRARAAKAERLLLRWQTPFIIGFRFIYGMRTVSPLVIGASAVTWRRYLVLNGVGAAVWAAGVSTLGYLFGKAVAATVGRYERYLLYALAGLIVAAAIAWLVRSGLRARLARRSGDARIAAPLAAGRALGEQGKATPMTTGPDALAIEGGSPVRAKLLPYAMHSVTEEDIAAVAAVLRGQWLTTGPNVDVFEKAVASAVGAASAAAVSSGTAALHLAYLAAGLGPGDEIVTTPMTFAATASAGLHVGARPVFADIDERTMNLDPAAAEAAVTGRTKAIVPVHYSGRPCEMDALREICDRRGLLLIEDACHALGAVYRGRRVGSGPADLAAWSFHPAKHIAVGEGGAVTSPDQPETVEAVRRLRNHGINVDARMRAGSKASWFYEIDRLGFNYRLADINAALGTSQLKRIEANVVRRRELAALYARELVRFEALVLPAADDADHESAWHLYMVRLRLERLSVGRAEVFAALRAEGIGVNVHYMPVYYHPLYERFGYRRGLCPVAERAYEGLLTLPLFASMTDADLADVVAALDKVLRRYRR